MFAVSYREKHIFGGQMVPGVSDLITCLVVCQAHITICQGIDYDFSRNMCFIHNVSTECTTLQPKDSCTHFRVIDCSMFTFVLNYIIH